jgi:hypothetical protein
MEEYLYKQPVDVDSHGQLGSIIFYLLNQYGEKETESIMESITEDIYKTLISKIKKNGIVEFEKHFKEIMTLEKGVYKIKRDDENLTIEVCKCPAIQPAKEHMERRNMKIPEVFCKLCTEVVNKVIARESGYNFLIDYNQDEGKCIQKFWRTSDDCS